jgi:hypothetical protein
MYDKGLAQHFAGGLQLYQLAAAQGYSPALFKIAVVEVGSAADRWSRHYKAALNEK